MSARSLPIDVRDRLRAHQEAESQAVAAMAAATARREAAETRRDELVATHDEFVRIAVAGEEAALVNLANTSGVERAAALLDVPIATVRKVVRAANGTE